MPAPHIPKQRILDVGVSTTSYDQLVNRCADWIAESRAARGGPLARYMCFLSVHGLITARDNAEVRRILNAADVVAPDGMPVVWALRSFGFKHQTRVYGPTAMIRLCESAETLGHRVFLYGGTDRSLAELRGRLLARFPALDIVGAFSPPFRPLTAEEDRTVVSLIRESNADLVFVGISTPKQERWMDEHRELLPGLILAGVGAAFDFHAGRVRQAPAWMQRRGLEWMFRLSMEPARLWKRYLLVTPRFLPLWAAQWAASVLSGNTAERT